MLSFIPTPIGNREDITLRALRLLREIDVFFCEDTATAKKLLNMYEISLTGKHFYALTSFTDPARMDQYIQMIHTTNIGVMSEAGTPGLSDPGKNLIKLLRENNLPFEVLPWASALIPAVVAAYCDTSSFVYKGFLPMKKWRQTALKEIIAGCMGAEKDTPQKQRKSKKEELPTWWQPHFFYESVHRIEKLLEELHELWFSGTILIARELSKMFEQKLMGTADELLLKVKNKELIIKWEFVVWMRC